MVAVLADPSLYEYTGGEAPTLERLRRRYAVQVEGQSKDLLQGWFNWVVRVAGDGTPVGFVQATLERDGADLVANIAWIISPTSQGQGIGSEAATAMALWLRSRGVNVLIAHIHPEHDASMGVARRLGLHPTSVLEDGERHWEAR